MSETQVRQRVYTAAAAVAGGLSYYSLAVARSLPTRVRWVSTLSGTMASAIGGRVYANTTEPQPMILDDTPMERAFASPEANTFLREMTASAVGGAATGVAATVALLGGATPRWLLLQGALVGGFTGIVARGDTLLSAAAAIPPSDLCDACLEARRGP